MNLLDLTARIILDTSDYDDGIDHAGDKVKKFGSALKTGLGTAAKAGGVALGAVGATAKAGGLAIGAVGAAAGGAVAGLLALEESTEEYRVAMGKLNTAYEAAGMDADTAQQAYTEFYKIIGDTDTATEASQLLSKLTQSQEDVTKWTNIAAGVWGTYGDALPVEGLIEASNETAKVGVVTGGLADALNWAGLSEDDFNLKLAECSDESERNKLIMDTLAETYRDASNAFYKNSEAVVKARENQAKMDAAMGKLGDTVAKVKNGIVADFTPAVATATEALSGLILGTAGADKKFADAIGQFVQTAAKRLPDFIEFGARLLGGIISGIGQALPSLMTAAVDIISSLASYLSQSLPVIIPAAVETVLKFIEGLTNPESSGKLVDGAASVIGGLIEGLSKAVPLLIAYAPEIIANLITGIIAAIPKLLEVGVMLVQGLISGIIQGIQALPEAIMRVVNALVDGFKELLGIHSPSTVFAEIGVNIIAGLLEGISTAWETIIAFFTEAIAGLLEFLAAGWESVRISAATAWEGIVAVFVNAWAAIQAVFAGTVEFFSGVFSAAWAAVQEAWSTATEFFTTIGKTVQDVFTAVCAAISQLFSQAWTAIQEVWNAVVPFFTELGTGIRNAMEECVKAVTKAFSDAWAAVQKVWSAAVEFFSGIWQKITSTFSEAESFFHGVFSDAFAAVKNAWSGITEFFQGVMTSIKDVFSDLSDDFRTIGKDMLEGIWDGISDKVGWLKSKVRGVVNKIKSWFTGKEGFDEHSPSKWANQVFRYVLEGGGNGLTEGTPALLRDVSDVVDRVKRGISLTPASFDFAVKSSTATYARSSASLPQRGGDTYNFYSPKPLDHVSAAREMKKAKQQLALGFL